MKKIRDEFKRLGARNALLYLTSRLLEKLTASHCRVIKYYFVAQPVPLNVLARRDIASNIAIYRVTREDPIVQEFPRPKHVIARRFADGAVCFVAVRSGVLAGFIWLKEEQYMEDEVRCLYRFEPRGAAAWDFDVWVAPDFRLTRTFARLWDAANGYLREHGYRWSVSRISAFNPGSLASHRRLGMVHLHTGLFLVCQALQLAFFSCAPYVHLSLRPDGAPVLRFRVPARAVSNNVAERTRVHPLT